MKLLCSFTVVVGLSSPIAGHYGVCVTALEAVGLPLIVHCIGQWLVESGLPADFISSMPTDPLTAQDTGIDIRVHCIV